MVKIFEIEDELKIPPHPRHGLSLCEKPRGFKEDCSICEEEIKDDVEVYYSSSRKVFFHKSCVDLLNEIQSSLHPQHTLSRMPYVMIGYHCYSCGADTSSSDLVYKCSLGCDFQLDFLCALLDLKRSSSIKMKKGSSDQFEHFAHKHPLIFREMEEQVHQSFLCFVCTYSVISGPIYECSSCRIYVHKSCAELPRELQSHSHPEHSLFLVSPSPPSSMKPSLLHAGDYITRHICRGCMDETSNFNYFCPMCDLSFDVQCLLPFLNYEDHQHVFIKISRLQIFRCQACGKEDKSFPWVCNMCYIFVHGKCAKLPQILRTFRHNHLLKLTYYYGLHADRSESDKSLCEICRRKVNKAYVAIYSCSECNYVAHLDCTQQRLDNRFIMFEVVDSDMEEHVDRNVLHQHKLTLTNELDGDDDENDTKHCDGCMHLIQTPFYKCAECVFFLHKQCATLPRKITPRFFPGTFTLKVNKTSSIFKCRLCGYHSQGFEYENLSGSDRMDLRCASISNGAFTHLSHKHLLHLATRRGIEDKSHCSSCGQAIKGNIMVCVNEECDFSLDFKCASLPYRARHGYDRHALQLTYSPEDDSGEYYCDICEEERDPKSWFYHCPHCFFSAHPHCVLGKYPYLKRAKSRLHPHLLTFCKASYDIHVNGLDCCICQQLPFNKWMLECARCKFIYTCGEGGCFQTAIQNGELTLHYKG